jgi:hypothetical protein
MRFHAALLGFALIVATTANDVPAQESPPSKKAESAEKPPKNEAVIALLKTQLQAAQKCYRAAVDSMQVDQVGGLLVLRGTHPARPDLVYTWSVRWLDAQRELSATKDERIAAFETHQKRMKDLRATVKMVAGTDTGRNDDGILQAWQNSAAEWYLAEAELWLLKERGK